MLPRLSIMTIVSFFLISILSLGLVYGAVHPSASLDARFPYEGRGVWVYASSFNSEQEMREVFSYFSRLNLTMIFFLVKDSDGLLYYNSSLARAPVNKKYAWALDAAVGIAHEFGLELHAWLVIFSDRHLAQTNTSLAAVHFNGNVSPNWTCPSSRAVRDYNRNIILEIVGNFSVDGIHLDYIRYENRSYCYCSRCRAEFMSVYGFDPRDNPNAKEWIEWRTQQIESFVSEVKTAVQAIKPQLKVSAAVYVILQDAALNRFQNWKAWADKRIVSFLVLMSYTHDVETFKCWTDNITGTLRQRVPVLMGIGLHKIGNYIQNETEIYNIIEAQIDITRRSVNGSQGWALFRYFTYKDNSNFTRAYNVSLQVIANKPPIRDQMPPFLHNPIQDLLTNEVHPWKNVTVAVVVCDAGSGVNRIILSYSINEGLTWANVTMDRVDEDVYVGQIPNLTECTKVSYRIIAYDNFRNQAIQAEQYHIISEAYSWQLLLALIIFTTAIVLLHAYKKKLFSHE